MSDTPQPLPITVVIPAYNRPEMTAQAVRSAVAQVPRPPAEVLVVDDCSSDDTGAAAEAAGARVIRHEVNGGESVARNTGIAAATTPWVATLDSDDRWLPHHLAALWPHAEGAVLVSSTALAVGEDPAGDAVWGIPGDTVRDVRSPADLLPYLNFIVVSGALLDRAAVLEAGGFVPGMTRCADLDLWLRLLDHGIGRVTPDVTLLYTVHDGQISDDRGAMREAFRDVVRGYADRSWWTPELERRFEGVLGWDELRAALQDRDWGTAARLARPLVTDPERRRGALGIVRWRRAIHRRDPHMTRSGATPVLDRLNAP